MRRKFAFIGAGSLGFTRGLVRDILTCTAFRDAEFALMDIDAKRLEYSRLGVEKIIAQSGCPATVTATMDRAEALKGADGVLITILQGGVDVWRYDIEIPKKYGVDICVGDTRGPAGIFRFLRTAPVMKEICEDVERYCPGAIVLNYTNPMAMLCRYLQSETRANVTGLCHSVQHTAQMIAKWCGAQPGDDVQYTCAGINHQAFYLDFTINGKDAYPLLREAVKQPENAAAEPVRNEIFRALGYYPTESSGHNSEYSAWFRKRPDLIEKYCTHGTSWNPGHYAAILNRYLKTENTWEQEFKEWLENGEGTGDPGGNFREYAADIFNAVFGDHTPFPFNGNLRNFGYITNLPQGACVEVPVLACKDGLIPQKVVRLPDEVQLMVGLLSGCEELAVRGAIEGDPEHIYHSILFDPLTSAVLSPEEIRAMTREMFEKNRAYLSYFKSLDI